MALKSPPDAQWLPSGERPRSVFMLYLDLSHLEQRLFNSNRMKPVPSPFSLKKKKRKKEMHMEKIFGVLGKPCSSFVLECMFLGRFKLLLWPAKPSQVVNKGSRDGGPVCAVALQQVNHWFAGSIPGLVPSQPKQTEEIEDHLLN